MSRENVEIVRQAFDAWNAGDLERVIEALDPELEFTPLRSLLDGASYHGPDGMRQFAADAAEEWDYLRITSQELRDFGDRVLLLGCFDVRGRASGVELEFPAAWLARLRDGKIVQLRAYSDRGEALAAVSGGADEPGG